MHAANRSIMEREMVSTDHRGKMEEDISFLPDDEF